MAPNSAKRKLTTILAADVVGYTGLMAVAEEAALATLKAYRDVIGGLVGKHDGRIFNTAGDAVLAEFGSAVEAVRCAISIQEDLAARNSLVPEDRQMWFRIGINVGDVMVENDDLFGDGVNVAARLEGLAERGGICISGSTFGQVKNKLSVGFHDIGAQKVKNIPDLVPAFRIVPGQISVKQGSPAASADKPKSAPGSKKRSVAIAGAVVLAAALGASYFAGLLPSDRTGDFPFDGEWKVSVDSLSGCLDNSSRSFRVTVRKGIIDEPHQQFPKAGSISADGEVRINATDRAGKPMNSQVATITRNMGRGRFQGRKPTCKGTVTMVRLD